MTFPAHAAAGLQTQVARSIRRRAIAIAALESGETKEEAADRAGITRNHLNRLLRPEWRPGA